MAHLTKEQNLVKDIGIDLQPISGFDLLLFRKGEYYRTIPAGKKVGLSMAERMAKLTGFAVRADPELQLKFTEKHTHNDKVHHFFLEYRVHYHINGGQKLLQHLSSDPLARVRNYIADLVGQYLAYTSWEELREPERFLPLKRIVFKEPPRNGFDNRSSMELIKDFANNLGFEVSKIDFDLTIPDKFTEVEHARYEDQKEAQLEDIRSEKKRREKVRIKQEEDEALEQTLRRKEGEHKVQSLTGRLEVEYNDGIQRSLNRIASEESRQQRMNDALVAAVTTAITSIGEGIDDVSKLRETIIGATEIQALLNSGGAMLNNAQPGVVNDGKPLQQLLMESPVASQSFISPIEEVVTLLRKSKIEDVQQREIFSVILHLSAILAHQNDHDDFTGYKKQLDRILDELKDGGMDQTEISNLQKSITEQMQKLKMKLRQW